MEKQSSNGNILYIAINCVKRTTEQKLIKSRLLGRYWGWQWPVILNTFGVASDDKLVHWDGNIVMLTKLSLLDAQQVVKVWHSQ